MKHKTESRQPWQLSGPEVGECWNTALIHAHGQPCPDPYERFMLAYKKFMAELLLATVAKRLEHMGC